MNKKQTWAFLSWLAMCITIVIGIATVQHCDSIAGISIIVLSLMEMPANGKMLDDAFIPA